MQLNQGVLASLLIFAVSLIQVSDPARAQVQGAEAEILKFEEGFSSALARNDLDALEHYLSKDWSIVSGDGLVITRARFLSVIASGDLKHDKMSFRQPTIRLYDNVAVATSHAKSGGSYKGVAFQTDEIGTDIIVKIHGRWICVLTQLTTVAQK